MKSYTQFKNVCLLAVASAILMLPAIPGKAQFRSWRSDPVDIPHSYNFTPGCLALNSLGSPVMVSCEGDQLYYLYPDKDDWLENIIDSTPNLSEAVLSFTSDGFARICYHDVWNKSIKYTRQNSTGFTPQILQLYPLMDLAGFVLSSDGFAHLILNYYDISEYRYIYEDESGFHEEILRYAGDSAHSYSMGLDPEGNVLFLDWVYSGSGVALILWTRDSTGWQTQLLQTEDNSGQQSLAIGTDGIPKLIYTTLTTGFNQTMTGVRYVYFDGASWIKEDVMSAGGPTSASSILLDDANNPRFCCLSGDDMKVYCVNRDSSGWHTNDTGIVLPETSVLGPSILDNSNKMNTVYRTSRTNEMRFLTETDLIWKDALMRKSGAAGWSNDVAIDHNDYAHISYIDTAESVLKYAENSTGQWLTTTIDSTLESIMATSICVDTQNHPHIAYFDLLSDEVRYAGYGNPTWIITTIDSIGNMADFIDITIDGSDNPRIVYCDASSKTLWHAWLDNGSWKTESIDTDGAIGRGAIQCDSNGTLHVCYHAGCLRHAWKESDTWQIETVDSDQWAGRVCDLAIDSDNNPHIAYQLQSSMVLQYAAKTTSGWQLETIDADEFVANDVSIKIDSLDRPHIAYVQSCSDYLVKYAFKDTYGWHREFIGNSWEDVSLALDSSDIPCVTNRLAGLNCSRRIYESAPEQIGVKLEMPGNYFYNGKSFNLRCVTYNYGSPLEDIPLFVILQFGSYFFYYPSWDTDPDWKLIDLNTGVSCQDIIPDVSWPDTSYTYIDNVIFWAAVLNPQMNEILGGMEGLGMTTMKFGPVVTCK